uniref:RING-type domain-containing protein n=1 Tax=Nicotiana tabacum TaxID=4097 RepID=A0A1S3YIB0_TOBAC|nr:PREDICTED: uncharacterized protein LOC107776466 [Nicotiana tabacum]XP_016451855.1 PREDICTED: uncharacterized protein LOC107776466 [Nicotiana tabacum]
MDGEDRVIRRRKSLAERLGLKGIGCCGSYLGILPATLNIMDYEDDIEEVMGHHIIHTPSETASTTTTIACLGHIPGGRSGMNLAAALAAERHFQEEVTEQGSDNAIDNSLGQQTGQGPSPLRPDIDGPRTVPGTPARMSLMRLLEETEIYEGELMEKEEGVGGETVCCVCMQRKKGAAFIPCGHTFCRVCSRELWVNRGCCPLCNRSILEILDIY